MKSKMLIFGCIAALVLLTGCNTPAPTLSVSEGGSVTTVSANSTTVTDTTVTTATDGTTAENSTTARQTAISTTTKSAAATTKKQTIPTTAATTKKPVVSTTEKPTTATTFNTTTTAAPIDIAAVQQEVFRLVNEERTKAGLSALTYCYAAQSAADIRAQEIVQSFSHTRPDGSSCFTALEGLNLTYQAAGENIAFGYTSPAAVMNGWMNSEGHRQNILSSNFNAIVIGFKDNYWVQLFLKL